MDWKKLSCTALAALGLTACGGAGDEFYEGRFTAVALYPESTRAISRTDGVWLNGYEHDVNVNLNPDLCDLVAVRGDQGRLQLRPGTRCNIFENLAPREGTFIAVITDQAVVQTDSALALQLRGTIHEGTAEAPSEGELVLTFQGQLAAE